ncbi:MAG: YigZ family protein [Clostridiales bacterium]|nr:YigZ family protein [Clostridiales bacterium]
MPYKTVLTGGRGEIEEKKSRFIATVRPISTESEALDIIASIRKEFWDARHNCYAYTVGSRGELQRCSDDGEPGGAAGRPILSVLSGEEIRNCIIVVTRYFGGTLLGTGGLVRAYQSAAKEGLAHCTVIERQEGQRLTICTDYSGVGKLQFLMATRNTAVLDSRYTDTVEMDVILPVAEVARFTEVVTEATSAKARILTGNEAEFAIADGGILIFDEK